jgi:DNA-directed RNA polymerase II subunit RPB2
VYDIEVEKTNSFLADGVVAHNCMISHGVSRFLLERLYDMSDPFTMSVCPQCGMAPKTLDGCDVCDDQNKTLTKVQIPYACKLLFQELNAMGVRTQIFPSEGGAQMVPQIVERFP